MTEENYETNETLVPESFVMNEGITADEMLKKDSVQEQFAGYYYDGKANSAAVKEIERIMLNS